MSVLAERLPRSRAPVLMATACWGALLLAILAGPYYFHSPNPGDDLTRYTVRLALLYYGLAAALMTRLYPDDWRAASARGALARGCWTLAWLAYLVHLGMAFHHYHGWSHADAIRHTRAVSGFGEGIFVSHLFTLVWTLDVLTWLLYPAAYATRSPGWGALLHGFLAFIIFCATVVYEQGFIRWAGLVLLGGLGALWLTRRPTT